MNAKLTLRLDDGLIAQAKAYARRRGKSISRMVAEYFGMLGRPTSESSVALTPLVRSLKGSLRGSQADVRDIRGHWESKHL